MKNWRAGLCALQCAVLLAAPAGAIDLTGTWRVEHSSDRVELVDVVQTSNDVSMVVEPVPGFVIALSGTFDPIDRILQLTQPGCSPPSCFTGVSARVQANGDWFDGYLILGGPPLPGSDRTLARRCECVDGNENDGDGCDRNCRVEPCYTCVGSPSVCTPTADGGACEDRLPCTSGEICSAGLCGGGAAVSPCIDLSGDFDVHSSSTFGDFDAIARVEQDGSTVLIRDAVSGAAGAFGTLDFTSGAMSLKTPNLSVMCLGFETGTGTAAAGGASYALSGLSNTPLPHGCFGVPYTTTATRRLCGNGITAGGEVCDDGNFVNGDGCDNNCTPTACGNGVVSAGEQCDDGNTVGGDGCSPTCSLEACGNNAIDGTEQCDDGNGVSGDGCDSNCTTTGCGNGVRTSGEGCDDGNTTGGDGCDASCAIEPCWQCGGVQPSVCATTYQAACTVAGDPGRAQVRLLQRIDDTRDIFAARSGPTAALPLANLGDPSATTAYQVCLFDRSLGSPGVLFGARVPAGGTCGGGACWRSVRGGFAYRSRDAAPHGIDKLLLVADRRGSGQMQAQGRGAAMRAAPSGLPALPLPLPVEAQVQRADDPTTCFAVAVSASGVQKNDAASGRFQGHGGP